ncbi:MAG: toll/interleukin-1 receptor domain-containing protein [Oculatellaceae cyanobacterium Prado106]|jgi:hypothetical protein|nr:toll/interleukin-1 receptor domain-containing protein [Oculatellaceae cyanobacterium Prado106]
MAKVFFSYSRKDRKWVDRVRETLKPLLRGKNVSLWSDMEIRPGENWQEAIQSSIDQSQVAILLISADYLASHYLADVELPLILEKSQQGKLHILPVVTSPTFLGTSDLKSPLLSYSFVNSQPLSTLTRSEQEKILWKLSETVHDLLSSEVDLEIEAVDKPENKYSAALNKAISNIGGNVKGMNILGVDNIFFEAEERLAQRNDN